MGRMNWNESPPVCSAPATVLIPPSWPELSCFPGVRGTSQFSGAFSLSSVYQWPVRPKNKKNKVLRFSSWTRPPLTMLQPPPPAECTLPDCIGEVAPSSWCSLETPNCPDCTEEEQASSRHPPRQPRLQTQGLYQDTPSCLGTLRKMEEGSSLWIGKDIKFT